MTAIPIFGVAHTHVSIEPYFDAFTLFRTPARLEPQARLASHRRKGDPLKSRHVAAGGGDTSANSNWPSVSADGQYVAFSSWADNLVPNDANGESDVFVRDLQTGTTRLVSVASDGTQANGASFTPSISADGDVVAFRSDATNLVANDTEGQTDVFVHTMSTGRTGTESEWSCPTTT